MTSPSPAKVRLSPEQASFICSGLSITACSRDLRLTPSICRVIACKVSADLAEVTLFMVRQQAQTLLRDIEQSGVLAVVFSLPSSHKTLQIKTELVRIEPFDRTDLPALELSSARFAADLEPLGYSRDFSRTLHHYRPEELLSLVFYPAAIFDQTPGPNAGSLIPVAAAAGEASDHAKRGGGQ